MSAPTSSQKSRAASVPDAAATPWPAAARDYLELAKPEISLVVTLSAGAGFLLGSPEGLDVVKLGYTLLGTALCAGGVGALNHYLERRWDAQMRRTEDRPLPAGRLSPKAARRYGAGLVIAGVSLLCPLVNPLTGVLAALTAVLYLFVYTPAKRRTKHNTLIGTVPGALPALGGYAAATGTLGAGGWVAFGILAAWQMPHFLTLAWMYREDYARGGYRMLPVVEPEGDSTARQTLFFTVVLFAVALAPAALGLAGWLYLAGAFGLGLWFLTAAVDFYRSRSGDDALRVFKVSIYYIPLLFVLIAADRLV